MQSLSTTVHLLKYLNLLLAPKYLIFFSFFFLFYVVVALLFRQTSPDSEASGATATLVPAPLGPKLARVKLAPRPSLRFPLLCCKLAGGGGNPSARFPQEKKKCSKINVPK